MTEDDKMIPVNRKQEKDNQRKNDKKTINMSASDFREIFGEQKYIT